MSQSTYQSRYQRQTILPEIGKTGQDKLGRASVLCIGAGGLGAPALLYLAAAGIGHLGIADFDRIDESNLQRQILYHTSQTGQPKAETAAQSLKALNPDIDIEIYAKGLNINNVEALFCAYDIIIDGTDNFEAKFLINDAGVKFSKPVIYGAIQKFEGQVCIFDATQGPCYRCLYPAPPKEHIQNCAQAGVIGAVAGIAGVAQAMQAIMLIVKHESFEPLIGRLWMLDARTMDARILDIPKNTDCPICSKEKNEIMLHYSSPVCGTIPELTPDQVKERTDALLIDVRELDEWEAGHIEGARHVALSDLKQGKIPNDLPQDQDIILYCLKGIRSMHAAQILRAQGYLNLWNMSGGYEIWNA